MKDSLRTRIRPVRLWSNCVRESCRYLTLSLLAAVSCSDEGQLGSAAQPSAPATMGEGPSAAPSETLATLDAGRLKPAVSQSPDASVGRAGTAKQGPIAEPSGEDAGTEVVHAAAHWTHYGFDSRNT